MEFGAADRESAARWQEDCRDKLFELMMGGGRPVKAPLAPEVLQRIEIPHANYYLEEITLQVLPDRRAHCWLAAPVERKSPTVGVLAIHGHYGTGEQVVKGEGLYWYGRHLAEMGCVVIAPDVGSHDLQHSDWTLMGERVWDCLRALDYLAGREDVDPGRLAVAGLSLGGETAMYVGALDERLRLIDSSGWLTTISNLKNGHCPCWDFPGLEESFEFSDVFACVAPRTLICEMGERDDIFPMPNARKAFGEIRRAYEAFGAADALHFEVHPGGHLFNGRRFLHEISTMLNR